MYDVEKIYKLEDNLTLPLTDTQVFMISSNLLQFKRVLNVLESNNAIDFESEPLDVVRYHIIVIPKLLNSFELLLEESGMYGQVKIHSFMWQFICLDQGLISLELPNLFTEYYVNRDLSLLTAIGKSLYFLFDIVGKPKVTISIGKYAQNVFEHIDLFENNLGPSEKTDSDFGAILIMDRSIDYITPLLTSNTYTGLLGEIYKINGGVVETRFPEKDSPTSEQPETSSEKSKVIFTIDNLKDSVYSEIKHRHISEVSDILGNQTRQFKLEKQSAQDMALSEIKTYVQTKLQSVTAKSKYLSCHLHACEKIMNALGAKFEKLHFTERSFLENINKNTNLTNIEDYIMTENQLRSLRLFCLISLTQKLTWDEFNNLKLQYLNENGYNLLYIFQNLINCGLMLQPQNKLTTLSLPLGQKKDFYSLANKLKLIPSKPEEVNVRSPTCPSYVFGGNYIPVVAQLLKFLVQAQNLNEFTSKVELLEGSVRSEFDKPLPLQQRTILVFVIGGLTYSEIAACHLIEKLCSCKIILASNCLLTGNDLVNMCI